jgi:hypothetical protein
LRTFTQQLYVYTKDDNPQYFLKDANGMSLLFCKTSADLLTGGLIDGFTLACDLKADLSGLSGALSKTYGPKGVYWRVDFQIGILFGKSEVGALIIWKENVRVDTAWTVQT